MSLLTRLIGGGRRRLRVSAAVGLLLAAAAVLGLALSQQQHAPQPAAPAALRAGSASSAPATAGAAGASGSPSAQPSAAASPSDSQSAAPVAVPTSISIPAIGVHHTLLQLGQNPDGSLQVPPLSDVATPGWDRLSPRPGQVGPSVIVGHVDGSGGGVKGVFYELGALHPGDTVSISRSDATVAVFRIDAVDEYAKGSFPTLDVYGNTADAQLRLITCGGPFDRATGHYLDNIVAYATLTGTHPA